MCDNADEILRIHVDLTEDKFGTCEELFSLGITKQVTPEGSSSSKKRSRKSIETPSSVFKKRKSYKKEKVEIISIDDVETIEFDVKQKEIFVAEEVLKKEPSGSLDEDPFEVVKVLKVLVELDGIKKIEDAWLSQPLYDKERIEEVLTIYLLQNDIVIGSNENLLPEEMFEQMSEQLALKAFEKGKPNLEDEEHRAISRKCVFSQKKFTKCIKDMRKCMGIVASAYKYCIK